MIRRPPRSTQSRSSAASDVYKRQPLDIAPRPRRTRDSRGRNTGVPGRNAMAVPLRRMTDVSSTAISRGADPPVPPGRSSMEGKDIELAALGFGLEPGVYGDDHPAPLEATLSSVIAIRVKETRQRKGLAIRPLSELTGISKGMLSKIENAQVSPSLALSLIHIS